jgi:hypothetical protein
MKNIIIILILAAIVGAGAFAQTMTVTAEVQTVFYDQFTGSEIETEFVPLLIFGYGYAESA